MRLQFYLRSRLTPRLHRRLISIMSKSSLIDALPERTRGLVLSATRDLPAAFGNNEEARTQINSWFQRAIGGVLTSKVELDSLESHLLSRSYLVSDHLTAADVVVYAALHETVSKESSTEYYSHPVLTRYFDHIQSQPKVRAAAESVSSAFSFVSFDLENAPKQNRHSDTRKKRGDKASKPTAAETTPIRASGAPSVAQVPKEKDNELKRQHGGSQEKKVDTSASNKNKTTDGKSGRAISAAETTSPVPSMIDLRVGHILDVQKHPDADGLYVEQIDIGEEAGPRTVVSGLVNYIPIEQMRDKRLIVVCNLKPVAMRGVKSYAMVLCATHKNGKEAGIEIVDPPPGSKPGDRVYFEGQYEDDSPLEQLNPKKKIFETIQPGFITLESREAAWVDPVNKNVHRMRTKNGYCTAPSFVGASLS